MVNLLPSVWEALGLIPSITWNSKGEEKRENEGSDKKEKETC